jgi:hypothetical protein
MPKLRAANRSKTAKQARRNKNRRHHNSGLHPVLQLQQTIGNRAVANLLQRQPVPATKGDQHITGNLVVDGAILSGKDIRTQGRLDTREALWVTGNAYVSDNVIASKFEQAVAQEGEKKR